MPCSTSSTTHLLPRLKALTGGGDKIAGLIRMSFEDANNYMKNGTLMRQVINKINGIDFNASDDRHMFGDIYEKLLKDLQSAGNAGEFYTPRAVTQFIVEQVDPRLGETILDPACGTGGFLTCAIEHLRKQAKTEADERRIQDCFAGIEKKHLPHVLCMTNLLLHGIDVPSNVRHDNTLARPLRDWRPKERVDVIVTNPPFGGMEEDGIEANFPAEFRTRETADLFLVLLMKILKPGGRAGLVLARRHPLRRRRQDPHQGGPAHRVQPAHHRPPAQRRLQSLHRHPHQPALLHQGPPTTAVWYYEHPYPPGAKSYNKGKPIRIEEFEGERAWWGVGRGRLRRPRGKRAGLARLHRPDQGRQLQPRPQEPAQPRHRPRRRGPPPARIRIGSSPRSPRTNAPF
jgi:type I restriction enzyme M protein